MHVPRSYEVQLSNSNKLQRNKSHLFKTTNNFQSKEQIVLSEMKRIMVNHLSIKQQSNNNCNESFVLNANSNNQLVYMFNQIIKPHTKKEGRFYLRLK